MWTRILNSSAFGFGKWKLVHWVHLVKNYLKHSVASPRRLSLKCFSHTAQVSSKYTEWYFLEELDIIENYLREHLCHTVRPGTMHGVPAQILNIVCASTQIWSVHWEALFSRKRIISAQCTQLIVVSRQVMNYRVVAVFAAMLKCNSRSYSCLGQEAPST